MYYYLSFTFFVCIFSIRFLKKIVLTIFTFIISIIKLIFQLVNFVITMFIHSYYKLNLMILFIKYRYVIPIHSLEFVRKEIAPFLAIPFVGNFPSTDINPTLFLRLTWIVCHCPSSILVLDLTKNTQILSMFIHCVN